MDPDNAIINGSTDNDNSFILEVFNWERIILYITVRLIAMVGITDNMMIILAVAF